MDKLVILIKTLMVLYFQYHQIVLVVFFVDEIMKLQIDFRNNLTLL